MACVFLLSVVCFRFFGGYGWLEATWMVVVTISTVGYGESTDASAAMQIVMILVILLGVSAAAYTCGGFIQLMLEGEVDRARFSTKLTCVATSLALSIKLTNSRKTHR